VIWRDPSSYAAKEARDELQNVEREGAGNNGRNSAAFAQTAHNAHSHQQQQQNQQQGSGLVQTTINMSAAKSTNPFAAAIAQSHPNQPTSPTVNTYFINNEL
jgi:hypothetical protein